MWTATFVLEIAKFRVFEPFVAELDAQVPSINMSALVDWTELGQAHTLLHVFAEHPSQVLRGGAVSTIPDGDATRTLGERVYRNVGRVRAAERAKRERMKEIAEEMKKVETEPERAERLGGFRVWPPEGAEAAILERVADRWLSKQDPGAPLGRSLARLCAAGAASVSYTHLTLPTKA